MILSSMAEVKVLPDEFIGIYARPVIACSSTKIRLQVLLCIAGRLSVREFLVEVLLGQDRSNAIDITQSHLIDMRRNVQFILQS